jgi:hypothetical protein
VRKAANRLPLLPYRFLPDRVQYLAHNPILTSRGPFARPFLTPGPPLNPRA